MPAALRPGRGVLEKLGHAVALRAGRDTAVALTGKKLAELSRAAIEDTKAWLVSGGDVGCGCDIGYLPPPGIIKSKWLLDRSPPVLVD